MIWGKKWLKTTIGHEKKGLIYFTPSSMKDSFHLFVTDSCSCSGFVSILINFLISPVINIFQSTCLGAHVHTPLLLILGVPWKHLFGVRTCSFHACFCRYEMSVSVHDFFQMCLMAWENFMCLGRHGLAFFNTNWLTENIMKKGHCNKFAFQLVIAWWMNSNMETHM